MRTGAVAKIVVAIARWYQDAGQMEAVADWQSALVLR
jgi:hypothetical protein